MAVAASFRTRRAVIRAGWVVSLLALIGQLAFGARPLPDPLAVTQAARLQAAVILCTGKVPPPADPQTHRHHPAELALCPQDPGLDPPAWISPPGAAGLPPPPTQRLASRHERPPGRGPPDAAARVGQPRAPPLLA